MNKIILTFLTLSLSVHVLANEVSIGRIVDVKGEGFISRDGSTKEIRKGDQLFANSEIVVEHSGQVTFTDNADHRFHLNNSSSVAIGINSVELRTGDIWFQSLNKTENYQLKTANAVVDYQGGEAIISYDSAKGKTQLMVINGIMKLSNLRTSELNMSVAEGNFSFIDYSYEEGTPRDPTPVGEKTYKQLVTMFKGVTPLDKKSEFIFKQVEPKREIASVHQEVTPVIVTDSKTSELEVYRNNVLKNPRANKSHVQKKETYKLEKVAIHIYGQKLNVGKNTHSRMPASVKEEPASQFTPEVIHESKTQERDNLIQALKNL